MKQINIYLIHFCLLFTAFIPLKAQTKVYISNFETVNTDAKFGRICARLLKKALDEKRKYRGVVEKESESIFFETYLQKLARAKELKCDFFLSGRLRKKDDRIYIYLDMYTSSNGAYHWEDLIEITPPVDLEEVFRVVAEYMGKPVKASQILENSIITQNIHLKLFKNYIGLSGGYGNTKAFYNKSEGPVFGITYLNFLSTRAQLDASFTYFKTAIMLSATANYLVLKSKTTPYLGIGCGFGNMKYDKHYLSNGKLIAEQRNYEGLMGVANAGILLKRGSKVSVRLGVKYFITSYTINNLNGTGLWGHIDILMGLKK